MNAMATSHESLSSPCMHIFSALTELLLPWTTPISNYTYESLKFCFSCGQVAIQQCMLTVLLEYIDSTMNYLQ